MGTDERDIICSETVTNGHLTVRIRMRQNGEVVLDCKQADEVDWQILQFYGKRRDMRLVIRPVAHA